MFKYSFVIAPNTQLLVCTCTFAFLVSISTTLCGMYVYTSGMITSVVLRDSYYPMMKNDDENNMHLAHTFTTSISITFKEVQLIKVIV